MKRKISISLLTLSLLLSLVSLPVTTQGQPPQSFRADSGVIAFGPHQILRLTVDAGSGNDTITVRFRQTEYTPAPCNPNSPCKFLISSQTTSAPITLNPGEAASVELVATTYGRGVVLSNSQNARVTVQIIDTATGQVDSILIALLLP